MQKEPAAPHEIGSTVSIPLLIATLLGAVTLFGGTLIPRAAAETTAPFGHTDQWKLVFEDTFDGDAIDADKWVPCYWWDKGGCTNLGTKEIQWYLPGNISVADGALSLTARPEITIQTEATYNYSSGIVTTGRRTYERITPPKFEFQYGYVEIRARVPAGQGLWPAFWMLPSRQVPLPEIDVMEVLGHEPELLHFNFHYRDTIGKKRNIGSSFDATDLSADWHVFAVDWSPDRIIWYFDGVEQWRYEDAQHVPHEPMYLILNLAVGGMWAGAPDATTRFPATFSVDYVRVWQRETERVTQ